MDQIIKVNIRRIKPNPNNPRITKNEDFFALVKSIKDFPDMLEKRPLVCFSKDDYYVVLGGNARLRACEYLKIKEVPIILCDEWTEEQKREFIIKDNLFYGVWDFKELEENWDVDELEDWGFDVSLLLFKDDLPEKLEEDEKEIVDKNNLFTLKISFQNQKDFDKYKQIIDEMLKKDGIKYNIFVKT